MKKISIAVVKKLKSFSVLHNYYLIICKHYIYSTYVNYSYCKISYSFRAIATMILQITVRKISEECCQALWSWWSSLFRDSTPTRTRSSASMQTIMMLQPINLKVRIFFFTNYAWDCLNIFDPYHSLFFAATMGKDHMIPSTPQDLMCIDFSIRTKPKTVWIPLSQ